MAEKSLFWFTDGFDGATGDGSAPYTQDEFAQYHGATFGHDGVLGYSGFPVLTLVASGTASPISVTRGGAFVRGLFFFSDDTESLAVATPAVGTTGGRVILRADYTAATIRLAVKLSADGVAAFPALTQIANDVWEVGIADFTITMGGVISLVSNHQFSRPAVALDRDRGLDWDSRLRLIIADGGVSTDQLADDAVTTVKLADDAVTADKIANRTRSVFVQATGSQDGVDNVSYPRTGRGVPLLEKQFSRGWAGFSVPSDFVSGMSVRAVFVGGATGNIYAELTADYGAIGEKATETTVVLAFSTVTFTDTIQLQQTALLSLAGVAAGDYISFQLERDGSAIQDTVSGSVLLTGFIVTYTADS